MNNRGASLGLRVVVVGIILLVVLFAASTAFGFGFKNVFDQVKKLLGISSSQLEELQKLHNETERRRVERTSAIEERCDMLVEAAEFIKQGKYDDAIKKYLEYNKVYDEKVEGMIASCYGVNTPEQVKFRILNVLREKFFSLTFTKTFLELDEEGSKFDPKLYNNLISKQEFESAVSLAIMSASIKKEDYTTVDMLKEDYDNNYRLTDKDELNSDYINFLTGYFNIKKNKQLFCSYYIKDFNNIILFINGKLALFEYKDTNNPIFEAMDYKFVSVPYFDFKQICIDLHEPNRELFKV